MHKKFKFIVTLLFIAHINKALADLTDTIYLKASAGLHKMNEIKDQRKLIDDPLTINSTSSIGSIISLAVGLDIIGIPRMELEFSYLPNVKLEGKGDRKFGIFQAYRLNSGTINHKASITSLIANIYLNVIDVGLVKIFTGIGAGAANLSEKVSFRGIQTGFVQGQQITESKPYDYWVNTKNSTNFVYSLTLGASIPLNAKIDAEIAYSFRDYGKTASSKILENEMAKSDYKGHHFLVGIKYSL